MERFFVDALSRIDDIHKQYLGYLDGLTTEQLDWIPGQDMNSLCILAIHVTQAERYWAGLAVDDPIQRDRDAEFVAKGHTLDDLVNRFTQNMAYYQTAFESASVNALDQLVDVKLFPDRPWQCTRGWALLHALDHSAEHLGHAGMTRQLLDSNFGGRS